MLLDKRLNKKAMIQRAMDMLPKNFNRLPSKFITYFHRQGWSVGVFSA